MAQSANSPQYKTVLQSWNILVKRLKSAKVETELLRQFYIKKWLDTSDESDADGMIKLALNKIETDIKNYEVFIEMLTAVTPLKDIVESMTSMYQASMIMTNATCGLYISLQRHVLQLQVLLEEVSRYHNIANRLL